MTENTEQLTWKNLAAREPGARAKANSVAVLMGYYNGNEYLSAQIESILSQTHRDFDVYIADDASPESVDIEKLALAEQDAAKINIGVRKINVGFCSNFLFGLCDLPSDYAYYAFSDQDDVWFEDKIARAVELLAQYPSDKPLLYCGRTVVVDDKAEQELGFSRDFKRAPCFANAMVQCLGGANTMLFNKAARDLLVESLKERPALPSHDWWCYLMVSGAGGVVHYDSIPCLKYRQHGGNIVGANNSWSARLQRAKELLQGELGAQVAMNVTVLKANSALLSEGSLRCLNDYMAARQSGFFKRLALFKRSGVFRQIPVDNLALLLAAALKKI